MQPRSVAALCRLLLIALSAGTVLAQERPATDAAPFPRGARCLFIGHSFFVPVAQAFDRLGKDNGFPTHRVEVVFAGGRSGLPGALWNNARRRKQVEDRLASGKIELLGMPAGDASGSGLVDYQRWIDSALKHNPKTQFFIGRAWTAGGTRVNAKQFDTSIEAAGARLQAMVVKLRRANPETKIYYLNYGKVASLMKQRYEAKQLPDIQQLAGRNAKSLFRDRGIGHAGPMMLELSALCWLQLLYGADPAKVKHGSFRPADVRRITTTVMKDHRKRP